MAHFTPVSRATAAPLVAARRTTNASQKSTDSLDDSDQQGGAESSGGPRAARIEHWLGRRALNSQYVKQTEGP